MKSDYHFTVMKKEAVENLNLKSNGTYLDATLGMGGHTIEITNTRNDINKIICKKSWFTSIVVHFESTNFSRKTGLTLTNTYENHIMCV